MIRTRMIQKSGSKRVEHKLCRLISIGVRMNRHARLQRKTVDLVHVLGCDVPKPVGRAVIVARRLDPRREALDRAVRDHLAPNKPQKVRRLVTQDHGDLHQVFGRVAHEEFEGHKTRWKPRLARDPQQQLDRLRFQA